MQDYKCGRKSRGDLGLFPAKQCIKLLFKIIALFAGLCTNYRVQLFFIPLYEEKNHSNVLFDRNLKFSGKK